MSLSKPLKFVLAVSAGSSLAAAAGASPLRRLGEEGEGEKPNIVVIFGDDIGQSNLSAYSKGLMGYETPNIDRLAREGMLFTDYYAEQSCTAGRSAFITGQSTVRTGLSKVGLPGAEIGFHRDDPSMATLLMREGYDTAQFGKNHFGDRDEHLPTAHGFQEFYGNLYHLNAEEEPEHRDYPTEEDFPNFRKRFGPRGVIHSWMGSDGKQAKVEDTGPLTRERMKTIDDDVQERSNEWIEAKAKAKKKFFVWINFTHMHFRTYVKPESVGQAGRWMGPYADAMIDHDKNVGAVLDKLDELGITNNTIVLYSTDNGPHLNTWPDSGMTPFRNEKNSNWEGAFRVPAVVRWPGHIPAHSVSNAITSHLDWVPTMLAAAGNPNITEELKEGITTEFNQTFKVHLDGYNLLPAIANESLALGAHIKGGPRKDFFYFSDDGDLVGLRYDNWKLVFQEQEATGTLAVWTQPFKPLRIPKMFNLRMDPYERADITSNTYYDWLLDHAFLLIPGQFYVKQFLDTFKEFPPRQAAASFSIDQVMATLQKPRGG
uniref:Sulfatase N-terminal domain-containing protein n=1 Tax=Chromera velia CCMP2878 TaxID=1169474 RepID=A0A0G4I712_9ALVE|mmetsp:Transcript_38183/g.75002  ORF Transcript_38183/g.75002 Transcript_38183/m.75002 type:complete len:543 (+) Transcript_38183:127-1755(+)|eukprot:Cvel_11480.t1-p1 / transcript=Cvel_11480.t1 / gene=Cvel_11480 / organism=Chromera_velia_CCMP2878 / gene_product=Arylsulfatase, putative / transcript_product=Arylsulfatase, putative / location=Cvel_scaffold723:2557-10277(+) / protein_length=542 / sequence_SO=supercontig / SO=protein_coding / is_pseudo=false